MMGYEVAIFSLILLKTVVSFALTDGDSNAWNSPQNDFQNVNEDKKFVLIDTDPGIDDAWAIFLLLQAHRHPSVPLTIVGISLTYGNAVLDNVTTNLARVLHAAHEEKIPVFRGSESPLVFPLRSVDTAHMGGDGFEDIKFPSLPPTISQLQPTHSVNAIIQLSQEYAEKGQPLSIIALGPLTNLALALRIQPNITHMLRDVHILGGNYQGVGNVRAAAEFNFFSDPEAAHVVLESFRGKFSPTLHVLPWETAMYSATYSFRSENLGLIKSETMDLLNKIESQSSTVCEGGGDLCWGAPADAMAAAIFIEPSVSTKSEELYAEVEVYGKLTRGMMVTDRRPPIFYPICKTPNVLVTTQVNHRLFEKMLIWAAGGPFYK